MATNFQTRLDFPSAFQHRKGISKPLTGFDKNQKFPLIASAPDVEQGGSDTINTHGLEGVPLQHRCPVIFFNEVIQDAQPSWPRCPLSAKVLYFEEVESFGLPKWKGPLLPPLKTKARVFKWLFPVQGRREIKSTICGQGVPFLLCEIPRFQFLIYFCLHFFSPFCPAFSFLILLSHCFLLAITHLNTGKNKRKPISCLNPLVSPQNDLCQKSLLGCCVPCGSLFDLYFHVYWDCGHSFFDQPR